MDMLTHHRLISITDSSPTLKIYKVSETGAALSYHYNDLMFPTATVQIRDPVHDPMTQQIRSISPRWLYPQHVFETPKWGRKIRRLGAQKTLVTNKFSW